MYIFLCFIKVIDRISTYLAYTASFILFCLMPLTLYAVAMRFFFHNPPGWDIEISEYMLIYITFLGTAWLLKRRGHVAIDAAYNKASPKSKRILDRFTTILGFIICLVLTWYAVNTTIEYIQTGVKAVETLKIYRAVIIGILPIGSLLLAIEFARQAFEHLTGHKILDTREKTEPNLEIDIKKEL